jgi:Amt family ammonium transporter
MLKYIILFTLLISVAGISAQDAPAPEQTTAAESAEPVTLESLQAGLDTLRTEVDWLWTIIAGVFVFFMQAGFAYVEAGFTRAKNVVNILMKNLVDMSAGSIAFWLVGFSIMFGPQLIDGIGLGTPSLADSVIYPDGEVENWGSAFLFFQMMFAATAATIVSGAMAERTKFGTYVIFSIIVTAVIYPVFGSFAWASLWGGDNYAGFLEKMGFLDFAGSTVVHSVGAWAGLAGAIILGPRIGKYSTTGKVTPILGHNMAMACLGVFILWLGWFGFNPGSTTSVAGGDFALIAINTQLAAAAGAAAAMSVTWLKYKKPDIGLTLNGGLAGLVAITAPCDGVTLGSSILIGAIGGILVVFSVLFFDQIKIDDPVGAVSVHGVVGAWGTLSCGLFNIESGLFYSGSWEQLGVQAIGVLVAFVWAFGMSLIIFYILKLTLGLRVSEEEEIMGLDILEHGNEAYPVSK